MRELYIHSFSSLGQNTCNVSLGQKYPRTKVTLGQKYPAIKIPWYENTLGHNTLGQKYPRAKVPGTIVQAFIHIDNLLTQVKT